MVFDLKKSFDVDPTLEENGVWEDLGDGAALLIARAGNPKYMQEYNKIPVRIREQIADGTYDKLGGSTILSGLLAKTILLGWKGVADNGTEIPYSVENAKAYLVKYPEFKEFVWRLATTAARFHTQSVAEDIKN